MPSVTAWVRQIWRGHGHPPLLGRGDGSLCLANRSGGAPREGRTARDSGGFERTVARVRTYGCEEASPASASRRSTNEESTANVYSTGTGASRSTPASRSASSGYF